jgi:hypothetical protein
VKAWKWEVWEVWVEWEEEVWAEEVWANGDKDLIDVDCVHKILS